MLLAIGKHIGEGIDDPRPDTAFLAFRVSWHGIIAQCAGRLQRLYDGKQEARMDDYVDVNVSMAACMFDRRCSGYKAIGYTIRVPSSAVPGWPADVVLHSGAEWKRDYVASIQRLVRDGVDSPLGNLFANMAQPVGSDSASARQLHSTSETFLFHCLEALKETKGCFRLKAWLPIAFDGSRDGGAPALS